MSVGSKRNRGGLGNIPDVDRGDAYLTKRHGVDLSFRKRIFQRCVVLNEIVWANNRERDIELPQGTLYRQLGGEVWNILEVLYAEDRVIHDMA